MKNVTYIADTTTNSQANFLFQPFQKTQSILLAVSLFIVSHSTLASITVTWQDNSNNEDGFIIEKRLQADNNFEQLSYLAVNTESYTDSDVIDVETYCYRISSFNMGGQSYSEEQCIAVDINVGSIVVNCCHL